MDKYFKYKYDDLFNPTIKAIRNLGDSGSVTEIEDEVVKILALSDDAVNEIKDLRLGVSVELVEEVKIKSDWFKNI